MSVATSAQLSPVHTAMIFGWTMSAMSAAICLVVRMPLGSPHWFAFIKAFLLSGAVISCSAVLTARRIQGRRTSFASTLLATFGVLFFPCFALLLGATADVVAYPLLLGLLAAGIRQMATFKRQLPRSQLVLAIACGCLAGLGYFFLINSRGLATILSPEQALAGTVHLDTLFHASIANMLVKHGVLSTGLDGFVPINYHFLSHVWLGSLSLWLRVSVLDGYYIGAQVIAIPILLFSLSMATYLFRPPTGGAINAVLVVLFPLLLLFITDIWGWTSYLVSESYFLSLIIFLFALPL